jgi:hypothetical protein
LINLQRSKTTKRLREVGGLLKFALAYELVLAMSVASHIEERCRQHASVRIDLPLLLPLRVVDFDWRATCTD